MFVVFVLLLLVPALVAAAVSVAAAFHDGISGWGAYHAARKLIFFVPFAWLILRPGGRIEIDSKARLLRYRPGWPKASADLPLDGLVGVTVGENEGGSLQRLLLRYRDHSEQALTATFSYGRAHHEQVARKLNEAISRLHAPQRHA
jgi:hypothetical protein